MAVISLDFFSNHVMKTVHAQVILPHGEAAQNVEPPYKTLYFLPGFSNTASDLMTLSDSRGLALEHGLAVVILDGDNSFFVDHGPMANYGALVAQELVAVTRKLFPLSDKREDTYIGGMSMGGYGALYNGIRTAETFSKIALLAPGFGFYDIKVPGTDMNMFPSEFLDMAFGSREKFETTNFNYQILLDQALENKVDLPEIFFSRGDADLLVGKVDEEFDAFLTEKGIDAKRCQVPGGHDMIFLKNALPHFFAFLGEKAE